MSDASTSGGVSPQLLEGVERARREPEGRFHSLAHRIDVPALERAYHRMRRGRKRSFRVAVGVDGVTKEAYGQDLEANLQDLHARMKAKRTRHQPMRRVHIPKEEGKTRPIGISAFEDKLVQDAVREVLEAIYEQDFLDCSYGFRPGRSAHDAVRTLDRVVHQGKGNWILEADIVSFLDSSSYSSLVHEGPSKRPACGSNTLIRKPFRFPRQRWTASSSPRSTRCNTVWRETPRRFVASIIGTNPSRSSATKRARSSSVMRMRHGAPGVSCSPGMNPSATQRCTVEATTPRIRAASSMLTSSPSGAWEGASKRGIFQ